MPKRPPYIDIIVTAVVMAFLTAIVIGAVDTRPETFSQITMRSE